MGKINIKFGYPSSQEEQEKLSDRAVFHDESVEGALCFEFEKTLTSLIKREGPDNFFDLVFFALLGQKVTAPKVGFSSYIENGHRLPMMELQEDFLMSKDKKRIHISDLLIDDVGELYQTEFDYEYVCFERMGVE